MKIRFLPLYLSLWVLTACYQSESTLTNSLIFCADKAPASLNPQISHDVASLDATTHQLYNRLVKVDPISQRFVPDITTHWRINEDKTTYTFFLRRDITFHQTDYFTPTRNLNADDVIFSFKRMTSPTHPFHSVNSDENNYLFNHPFSNLLDDIIKINDHTIQFILNKPDATLLAKVAAHYAVILSKEYALQLLKSGKASQIDFFPIGSGPYQFKNSHNHVLRYQSHKRPWQYPVKIENLIFDITRNSTKRYTKLLSGECDIISNPASSQINQISKNKQVSLSSQHTGNVAQISFNTNKLPFEQQAIRHALSDAIDISTIIDAVFYDTGLQANTLLSKHSWAYNPRINQKKFTPQESLDTLKALNFDFTQEIRILTPAKNSIFNPNFHKTAELIQSNWASIGIKSNIIFLRKTELEAVLLSGDYHVYLTGSSPYIKDPDNLFRPLLSCSVTPLEGNSSQWCDKTTQSLLDEAMLEINFMQRIINYYKIQDVIQEKRIYLPIAHLLRFDVFSQNISGLRVNPLTGIDFHSVIKTLPSDMVKDQ